MTAIDKPVLEYRSPKQRRDIRQSPGSLHGWLHTMWPAGAVERLPDVSADYSTRIPGVFVVGDLTGIPLLKFSSDSGARVVQRIAAESNNSSQPRSQDRGELLDLVIIGAGVSGMAAALEAKKNNLRFEILEASEPFSTIINSPKPSRSTPIRPTWFPPAICSFARR